MIRDLMILWKRVLSSLVDYSGLPMSWVKRLPILLVNGGRGFQVTINGESL